MSNQSGLRTTNTPGSYLPTPAPGVHSTNKPIINLIDELFFSPKPTTVATAATPAVAPSESSKFTFMPELWPKIISVFVFLVAIVGLAFSIINAIFLSTLDKQCRDKNAASFSPDDKNFIMASSIVLAVFFALLTVSSLYAMILALR